MATVKTTVKPAEPLTASECMAILDEPPVLVSRMLRMTFAALERRNPLLQVQLRRVQRRLLALNRLEFRALRAGWWEEQQEQTLAEMVAVKESYIQDPTLLIGQLDGRLTWIETATQEQLAAEARKLPGVVLQLEGVVDLAGHRMHHPGACPHRERDGRHEHAAGAPTVEGGFEPIRRQIMAAFFDSIAWQHPDAQEEIERAKQRLLALSPIRLRALRASLWQAKRDKPLSSIVAKLESWFDHPTDRLPHLEKRLDAVEALTSEALEEQAALLPRIFVAFEESGELPAASS
ncbi:MAG: hypothetical protein KGR26_07170 [Cyanobacteria bacterium REEB65]|nr:hypothetical protein [Cyanobacteria bacterium REEB65]